MRVGWGVGSGVCRLPGILDLGFRKVTTWFASQLENNQNTAAGVYSSIAFGHLEQHFLFDCVVLLPTPACSKSAMIETDGECSAILSDLNASSLEISPAGREPYRRSEGSTTKCNVRSNVHNK